MWFLLTLIPWNTPSASSNFLISLSVYGTWTKLISDWSTPPHLCSHTREKRQFLEELRTRKGSITVLASVNAIGSHMPPLVVKGKTHRSLNSWNVQDAPIGTRWTFQDHAYMNDNLGVKWFKDVFLTHCGTQRPQLLVLDGHKSHTSEFIDDVAIEGGRNTYFGSSTPHYPQVATLR